MWARSGREVDNQWSSTVDKTTRVQDVTAGVVLSVGVIREPARNSLEHPQSTALITVIRDSYLHPQITGETR